MNPKRALFTILFVLSIAFVYSKDIIKLYVCEQGTGQLLPRANVLVKGQKRGTATDKKGFFELSVLPKDSLKISHIGYATKLIATKNITKNDTVFLRKQSYEISSVTVRPKIQNRSYTQRIGVFSKKKGHSWALKEGSQLAFFINNPLKRVVLIRKLYFQLKRSRKYGCDITLRIMDRNPRTLAPQNDLVDREIFVDRLNLRKANKIDVESYNIFLPKEGAYLVIEWAGKVDKKAKLPIVVGHSTTQIRETPIWLNYRNYKWNPYPRDIYLDSCPVLNFSMEVIY